MEVFPILYTAQLKLRKISVDDIPALVTLADNPSIARYILNIPTPYREPDAVFRIAYVHQGFKAGNRYLFAIADKETDAFMGEISLYLDTQLKKAQLGYWLGAPYHGKGFTTEAVARILQFGFEVLQLERIFASCEAENMGSVRVLEKNKFRKNGVTGNVLQYAIVNPL